MAHTVSVDLEKDLTNASVDNTNENFHVDSLSSGATCNFYVKSSRGMEAAAAARIKSDCSKVAR